MDSQSPIKIETILVDVVFRPKFLGLCLFYDDDDDDDDDDDEGDDCDDDGDDGDDDDKQVRTNGPGHSNGKRGSHVSTVR